MSAEGSSGDSTAAVTLTSSAVEGTSASTPILASCASAFASAAIAWEGPQGWTQAEQLTGVSLPGGTEALMVTQADIDPTGSELYLGTYGAGYRLDLLRTEGVVTDLGSPQKAPIYGEGQCEAMSYDATGLHLYFTCEANPTPLARSACEQVRREPLPDVGPPGSSAEQTPTLGCHCDATILSPSLWGLILYVGLRLRRRTH